LVVAEVVDMQPAWLAVLVVPVVVRKVTTLLASLAERPHLIRVQMVVPDKLATHSEAVAVVALAKLVPLALQGEMVETALATR
jgi:hypothetical protein